MNHLTISSVNRQRTKQKLSPDGHSAIETKFPRLASQLVDKWGTIQADLFLDSLMLDDRGDRMGFPVDVLDELMFLSSICWHQGHLRGTLADTTSPQAFSFSGNRGNLCSSNLTAWVLV